MKTDNTSLEEQLKKTVNYLYVIEESKILGNVSPKVFEAIGMLRQLINEEFVGQKRQVSSQLLYDHIAPLIQHSIDTAVREARVEELERSIEQTEMQRHLNGFNVPYKYITDRIKQLEDKQ